MCSVKVRPAREAEGDGWGGRSPRPSRDDTFSYRRGSEGYDQHHSRRSSGASMEHRERDGRGSRVDQQSEEDSKETHRKRGVRGGMVRRRSSTTEYERARRLNKTRAPRAPMSRNQYRYDGSEDDIRRDGSPGRYQDRRLRYRSRSPIRGRRRDERSRSPSRSPRRRSRSRSPPRRPLNTSHNRRTCSVSPPRSSTKARRATSPLPKLGRLSTPSQPLPPLPSFNTRLAPTIGLQLLSCASINGDHVEEEHLDPLIQPDFSKDAPTPASPKWEGSASAFQLEPFTITSFPHVPVDASNPIVEDQDPTNSRRIPPAGPKMSRDLSHPTSTDDNHTSEAYIDESSADDLTQDDVSLRYQSSPSEFTRSSPLSPSSSHS